ncbi:MAG: Hsp20/alpha crystallin family protein [Pelolinea sp.]|nr:Hsp20/alpha crystallin family protein [Pelolinea sp.]
MTVYVRTPYRNISHMMRHPNLTHDAVQENKHVHFPMDVIEDEDKFTITAILPGIDPKEIDIQIQDKQVSLQGEFKDLNDTDNKYVLRERPTGKFHRSILLPDMLNASKALAKMDNGILSLSIPKSEEAKPKKIKVTTI